MAKFELQAGEQEIERVRIANLTKKRGPAKLILTDRRIVVIDSSNPGWTAIFGLLGGLFAAATSDTRIQYKVDRGSLERIDVFGSRGLVLHTHGEGYAAQHIQINNIADAERWKDRLMVWNADTVVAEPLPTARVIDR
jgi:hypothetical protein